MKRTSTVLVAVAMMVGAFGTMGCRKPALDEAQPEAAPAAPEAPAAAPQETAAQSPGATEEKTTVSASVALPPPPALRVEVQGRAPSAQHVWQRGYWRYEQPRTSYVWVPGHWENTAVRAPYAPPAPRYEDPGYGPGVEYVFVPGYWRWSGREYTWSHGHWSRRSDCGHYYRPRWEYRSGHWAPRVDRWSYERSQAWEREYRPRHQAPEAHHQGGHGPEHHQGGHGPEHHQGSASAPPQHHAGSGNEPPKHHAGSGNEPPKHHAGSGNEPPKHHAAAPAPAPRPVPMIKTGAVKATPAVVAALPAKSGKGTVGAPGQLKKLEAPGHRGRG